MPPPRDPLPLPDSLVTRPATTASLRAHGVGGRELAGPLWNRPWRGVHQWFGVDGDDPLIRILGVAELLPDGAGLGGWAALHLRGVTDLDGRIGLTGRRRPVLVCVGPSQLARRRPGLVIDRGVFDPTELERVAGVALVSAELAVCQVARREGVEEGLVAADAACRAGVTSESKLDHFVAQLSRRPGLPRMRAVAELADAAAESPMESRLRYVWVVEAGLPVPLVNVDVVDPRAGFLLGKVDLLDVDSGLVGEYDGAHHRDLARHTADNIREEALEGRNLTVARATSIDLFERRVEFVARLQSRYANARARDTRRDAWALRRPGA